MDPPAPRAGAALKPGVRDFLRPFLACRLCWRITLAVFALILLVEMAILVPSARQFEQRERQRVAAHAQIIAESVLAQANAAVSPLALRKLIGSYGVQGIALFSDGGVLVAAAGDAPPLPIGSLGSQVRAFADSTGNATLVSGWRSSTMPALRVALRSDASGIAQSVRAYQWRVGGLVLIIVLVVTVGTMLVMGVAVLRPVLRLRRSLQQAGADPAAAERHRIPTRRQDEIGQLIEAHNAMLEKISASARFVARHDPLTGLPNRAALTEYLDRECEAAVATLLLANVVQFRAINAGFGTSLGDRVIHGLASRLKEFSGAGDFIAHLGADRLALVRSGALAPDRASVLAEGLLRRLTQPFEFAGGVSVSPEVRVGIAQSDADVRDGKTLLAQADLALARAYRSEDTKYQFFSAALATETRARQALSRDLELALQRGDLSLALQPKFRLAPGGALPLSGAEVLLRWRHAERGPVSPAEFIPIAEANGLIVPIGAFVLDSACALSARWRSRLGDAPRLAVNLSAQQFALPDLLQLSGDTIARAGIPPSAIEFEITETAAMRDVQRTADTLTSLRELGIRVSIDDFGTGYSSLNYLRRFAVDAIKIDKSFVDDIGRDRNAEAICDAVLRLGQSLGTKVIAEGVETEAQAKFLRQRRCDEVQGYLYGRPVPAADFERLYLLDRSAAPA